MSQTTNGIKFQNWTPAIYRIDVSGILNENMSEFLGGMKISNRFSVDRTKVTRLVGLIRDQAELAGVLNNLYELHLPIISVKRMPDEKDEGAGQTRPPSGREFKKE